MTKHPLIHYQGQSLIPAYPPLQGFLLWPVVQLSSGLPLFGYWLRVCSTFVELSIYITLLNVLPNNANNFFRVLLLTFLPLPILSLSIWGQEEVLSFAFIFFGLLAWQYRVYTLAIIIWTFAVAAVKIFILPLLALGLLDCLIKRRYPAILLSLGIFILGYLGRIFNGGSGLAGVIPSNDYGNTLWSMPIVSEFISLHNQYTLSLVFCAVWGCLCIAYWVFSRLLTSISEMYALLSMGIFLLFYFANPEYFILPYAALLAAFAFGRLSYKVLVVLGLLLSCTWIHNILYMLCVSKKFLSCTSLIVYPYGSLVIANLAVVLAIILTFKDLSSKKEITG